MPPRAEAPGPIAGQWGALVRVQRTGREALLHVFSGGDGAYPVGALARGQGGFFYGVTEGGGKSGDGVIYRIAPDGSGFKVLHHFTGGEDGGAPRSGLLVDERGSLYGTTSKGGEGGQGALFRFSPRGKVRVLYAFSGYDGADPRSFLIVGSGPEIVGVTRRGGDYGNGTLFRFQVDETAFASLHSFMDIDGVNPEAPLLLGADGMIHGVAPAGGIWGLGTAFRISANGVNFEVVHAFGPCHEDGKTCSDGSQPLGEVPGWNGWILGRTLTGGAFGRGTIYLRNPTGTEYHILYSYEGIGDDPRRELVRGRDGKGYALLRDASGKSLGFKKVYDPTPGPPGQPGQIITLITQEGTDSLLPPSGAVGGPYPDPCMFTSLGAFTAPAGTTVFDTDALTYGGTAGGVLSGGTAVFVFDSISIPSGATVQGVGSYPLSLLSLSGVQIDGTVHVRGSNATPTAPSCQANTPSPGGAGGGAGGRGVITSPGPGNPGVGPGGGGAGPQSIAAPGGGGYGGAGGAGGGSGAGAGGIAYGDLISTFQGGSGGGGSGTPYSGCQGASGGGGGGALMITAGAPLTIGTSGIVSASGGNGAYSDAGASAGGSGGAVVLRAPIVTNGGAVRANGGGGGPGGCCGGGGGGGGGRLLLLGTPAGGGSFAVNAGGGGGGNPGGSAGASGVSTATGIGGLLVTKTDGQTTAIPGTSVTYTMTLTNTGPAAGGVIVSDSISAILSNASYTATATGGATGYTASGTGGISDTVSLPNASSITYQLTADIDPSATGTLANTICADIASAVDEDTLVPTADLQITKSDSPDPVTIGTNLTYTINFTSAGPSTATNVAITDAVPAETTFVSASVTSGAGWSMSTPAVGSTGNVVFSKGSVASGETASFTLVVLVARTTPGADTVTNTASASSDATDSNPANNTSTATTTMVCPSITLSPEVGMLPGGVVGTAYDQWVTASGGNPPYTYAVTAGMLPPSLSLNPSTGEISGMPTAAGTYHFMMTATDKYLCQGSRHYSITMTCPTITLSPGTLPGGVVGTAYDQWVTASGGSSPYTYAVTAGALPPSLSLNPSTGEVSGTPTAAGAYDFTITATDQYQCQASQYYAVSMACPAVTVSVSPSPIPTLVAGTSFSFTFSATGGTAPYAFGESGALPSGMTFSGNVLSGAPLVVGDFPISVTATDTYGCAGTANYTLHIVCPVITISPASLPGYVKGQFYTQTLTAVGAVGACTFQVTAGALPPGLTLSPGGVLSGTPTATGTWTFTVTALDANLCPGTATYTFSVFGINFYDDMGRAVFCVNFTDGAYSWTILAGPRAGTTYTGTAKVLNGGAKITSNYGDPNYFSMIYDPVRKRANGWLVSGRVYSTISDSNTTNNPPACR